MPSHTSLVDHISINLVLFLLISSDGKAADSSLPLVGPVFQTFSSVQAPNIVGIEFRQNYTMRISMQ
jgi:hypothetical protein